MTHRFSLRIATLLIAAGAATYLASRDDARTRRTSAVEERRSRLLETSRPADAFPTTAWQPPAVLPGPAEPVVEVEPVVEASEAERSAVFLGPPAEEEPSDPELTAEQRAQRIRLPLIAAIRGAHASPAERYRAMREALARSGPSSEPWTERASHVFESWKAALPKGLVLSMDRQVGCFLAGCEVKVRFESPAAYEQAAEAFRALSDADQHHGGRVQTPSIPTDDGTFVASWMMLRPNVAPPEGSH